MPSKNAVSTPPVSNKLPADGKCPRCGGLLREEVLIDENMVWHNVRTCIQCGNCLFAEVKIQNEFPSKPLPQIHSPRTLGKPSKSARKKGPDTALRKVSVPNLSPPPVPRTKEDWEGSYTIQCHTYAGYQYFRGLAAYYRKEVSHCRLKNDKLTENYRARLCENLAVTLGEIYIRQTRAGLRDRLRKERRAGRDNVEKLDRKVQALYKQRADLMLQAMSHLPDDPMVRRFREHMEALGQWDYLRQPRKSFERGVKRPYRSPEEADIDTEIKAQQLEGKRAPKILQSLKNRAATWEGQRNTNTLIKVQPKPFSPSNIPTRQAIEKRIKALEKASGK